MPCGSGPGRSAASGECDHARGDRRPTQLGQRWPLDLPPCDHAAHSLDAAAAPRSRTARRSRSARGRAEVERRAPRPRPPSAARPHAWDLDAQGPRRSTRTSRSRPRAANSALAGSKRMAASSGAGPAGSRSTFVCADLRCKLQANPAERRDASSCPAPLAATHAAAGSGAAVLVVPTAGIGSRRQAAAGVAASGWTARDGHTHCRSTAPAGTQMRCGWL
jgi:hypothetical protein